MYEHSDEYPVAVLIKSTNFSSNAIQDNYVTPLVNLGVPLQDIIVFTAEYESKTKASSSFIKEYLNKLLPELANLKVKHILVADGNYFKILTGERKAEPHYGYVLPCKIKGFEDIQIVLSLNHQTLVFDPSKQDKLDLSLETLSKAYSGSYKELGEDVLHTCLLPKGVTAIKNFLTSLHQYPVLAADIEAYSLRYLEAGIGTIAFAWTKHDGGAFRVDQTYNLLTQANELGSELKFVPDFIVRRLLREFFESYKGKIRWHNATYDLKCIIYALWMEHPLDIAGMLKGLHIMCNKFDDTKIITYLATNSCAGNVLGLKPQAHEHAGNWAKDDITDIRKIEEIDLLTYNIVDAVSTNYVYEKHWPTVVNDEQQEIYETLMLPSLKTIIQMELVGMPMCPQRIVEVRQELESIRDHAWGQIENHPRILQVNAILQQNAKDHYDATHKGTKPIEHFVDDVFNPGSPKQLQVLLYDVLGLPVIDYTATKQPAAGSKTLAKLVNYVEGADQQLLKAIIEHGKVEKVLSTFIPAFEDGAYKEDGAQYLHGSFNLGGTVSGRLSSNDPNLQNLPANSTYGKTVKSIFRAPKGWIFCGADFASLEDRINTLLTKDPNKIKVYTGHTVYSVEINGVIHHIRDDDTINFDGKTFTGEEFYEKYRTL